MKNLGLPLPFPLHLFICLQGHGGIQISTLFLCVVEPWFEETRQETAYCSAVHPNEDSSNLVLHDKHENRSFYARSSPVVQGKMVSHLCMPEAEPLKCSPEEYFRIPPSNDITDNYQLADYLWPVVSTKFISGETVCGSYCILISLLIHLYSYVLPAW